MRNRLEASIINNDSFYINSLSELVESFGYRVQIHQHHNLRRTDVLGSDLVVLSGGHGIPVITHTAVYQEEMEIIRGSACPVVGVCLGAQLIAHTFGADISRISRIRGPVTVNPCAEHRLLDEVGSFDAFCNHRWVMRNLPEELLCIATANDIAQVVVHRDRRVVGFQFHPEVQFQSGVYDASVQVFKRACFI
jgi:anthranilate/para-aminobenzoate synthase component II